MSSSLITPEVVGQQPQILENSPLTEAEQKEFIVTKTAITAAFQDQLNRNLSIGKGLQKIFERKLYRGKDGGRTWDQWLKDESAELTNAGPLDRKTAQRLRAFFRFRVEILPSKMACTTDTLPLPSHHYQVDALIGQLDDYPDAAYEMWKAAVSEAGGKIPSTTQVNRAALAYKANQENEARRLSAAEQERLKLASQGATAAAASNVEPPRDYSPEVESNPTPAIPAWEIQKDDSSVDAAAECQRISEAINGARKAVGLLRGILYSQVNTYGRDYMGFLRQVDAGTYSLKNIDDQVAEIGEDVEFIAALLVADVGEGELAKSTINVTSIPTRGES